MSEPVYNTSLSPEQYRAAVGAANRHGVYNMTGDALAAGAGVGLTTGAALGLLKLMARNMRKTPDTAIHTPLLGRVPVAMPPEDEKRRKYAAGEPRTLLGDGAKALTDLAGTAIGKGVRAISDVVSSSGQQGSETLGATLQAILEGTHNTGPSQHMLAAVLPVAAGGAAAYGGYRLGASTGRSAVESAQQREFEKARQDLENQMRADLANQGKTAEAKAAFEKQSSDDKAWGWGAENLGGPLGALLLGNLVTGTLAASTAYDWKSSRTGRKLLEAAARKNQAERMQTQPRPIQLMPVAMPEPVEELEPV